MAKIHLDRLRKKYKHTPIKGQTYGALVKEILHTNIENVQRKMARRSQESWQHAASKLKKREGTRMTLPKAEEVIPPRAVGVMKAAHKGELIRDTLRDRLTAELRRNIFESPPGYTAPGGKTAGRISPKTLKNFEKGITEVFKDYTQKTKGMDMPGNVHTIAVTEMRTAINNVKKEYAGKVLEENPDIHLRKTWIHNAHLSKKPRLGHQKLHGKTIAFNALFKVAVYDDKGKKQGVVMMQFPHDPEAPAGQTIGCNCDYDIIVSRMRRKK